MEPPKDMRRWCRYFALSLAAGAIPLSTVTTATAAALSLGGDVTRTTASIASSSTGTSGSAAEERRENDKIRFRARVAYDGSSFAGFQLQPDRRTVQGVLEQVLNQRLLGIESSPLSSSAPTLKSVDQGPTTTTPPQHESRGIKVVAASRTDAGVHARGQAIHFDVPMDVAAAAAIANVAGDGKSRERSMHRNDQTDADLSTLCESLNRMLTSDVRLWNLQRVPVDCIVKPIDAATGRAIRPENLQATAAARVAAARWDLDEEAYDDTDESSASAVAAVDLAEFQWNVLFDSTEKLYSYRLCVAPVMDPLERHTRWHCYQRRPNAQGNGHTIQLDELQRILSYFVGTLDFRAFAGSIERSARKTSRSVSTIRTVYSVVVVREDMDVLEEHGKHNDNGYWRIDFCLKGALYKQVRNMVGAALDVCYGHVSDEHLRRLLHNGSDGTSTNSNENVMITRADNLSKPAPPEGLTLEMVYFDDADF